MSILSHPARARWFNPTTAAYTLIADNLPNFGTHTFSPPGDNGSGDSDWVLILDAAAPIPAMSNETAFLEVMGVAVAGVWIIVRKLRIIGSDGPGCIVCNPGA